VADAAFRTTPMLRTGSEIRYRIVPILELHWEAFFQTKRGWIRPVVLETVRKLLACRTPARGCHVYQCPTCERIEVVPHSASRASARPAASTRPTAGPTRC
jgi:Transposase zinc-binding domain